jgi:succinate dehydrogenase / fumarate reductase cytochrome b subunit
MATRTSVFASSVGTKLVIALTGLAMVGFLIMHLAGNLLVLVGPDTFNHYSEVLVSNPLLVPAELGLLVILLAHVYKTVTMYLANRAARPVGYQEKRWAGHTSRKSVASTTMIYTGVVIFVFLGLHLRTFKYGAHYLVPDTGARDLYRLVIEVFSQPLYVAFYVVCMVLVGLHVRHGFSSAFQSLGTEHPDHASRLVLAGKVLAIVIGGGFALIPVLVFLMGARS